MQRKMNTQSGFSLVAVLLVLGVVSVAMLLISQAKFRAQSVSKAIKIKQSYVDINQVLINRVVDIFHKNLNDTCGGLIASNLSGPQLLDGSVTFTATTAVPVSSGAPPVHTLAQNRCRTQTSPHPDINNRFYFCVQLSRDLDAPRDSILNANTAFAEFVVEMIDLQTQAPITCRQYGARRDDVDPVTLLPRDGSAGMAVTMALYWANQMGATPNRFTYSQKALSYIANQN